MLLQARDPSVHAAILAHLNQKYGSGSGGMDPGSTEKNKVVRKTRNDFFFHLRKLDYILSLMTLRGNCSTVLSFNPKGIQLISNFFFVVFVFKTQHPFFCCCLENSYDVPVM